MSQQSDQRLLEKLRALPPERRAVVIDFVDFLAAQERSEALQAFLDVADRVAGAGAAPLGAEEIEAELDALRAARRNPRASGT